MRVAMMMFGSFGDCVNSTLMLEPIRSHFGDKLAALDLFTSHKYRPAFEQNPAINTLVEFPADTKDQAFALYNTVPQQVATMGYDLVLDPAPIRTQPPSQRTSLKHPELGENLIYSFVRALEKAGIPCPFPLRTHLHLTPLERRRGAALGGAYKGKRRVLMEMHGESGQTFWNASWTLSVGRRLMADSNTVVFLSNLSWTPEIKQLQAEFPTQCVWVGSLTIRECAELFDHCEMFFSVSSGLANACNTDGRKRDGVWVEVCNDSTVTTAPIYSQGRTYWHTNNLDGFLAHLASQKI
jgi:ADP-heptose:LPS heptosyltransferase